MIGNQPQTQAAMSTPLSTPQPLSSAPTPLGQVSSVNTSGTPSGNRKSQTPLKGIVVGLILLVSLVGAAVGWYLSTQQQDVRQQAFTPQQACTTIQYPVECTAQPGCSWVPATAACAGRPVQDCNGSCHTEPQMANCPAANSSESVCTGAHPSCAVTSVLNCNTFSNNQTACQSHAGCTYTPGGFSCRSAIGNNEDCGALSQTACQGTIGQNMGCTWSQGNAYCSGTYAGYVSCDPTRTYDTGDVNCVGPAGSEAHCSGTSTLNEASCEAVAHRCWQSTLNICMDNGEVHQGFICIDGSIRQVPSGGYYPGTPYGGCQNMTQVPGLPGCWMVTHPAGGLIQKHYCSNMTTEAQAANGCPATAGYVGPDYQDEGQNTIHCFDNKCGTQQLDVVGGGGICSVTIGGPNCQTTPVCNMTCTEDSECAPLGTGHSCVVTNTATGEKNCRLTSNPTSLTCSPPASTPPASTPPASNPPASNPPPAPMCLSLTVNGTPALNQPVTFTCGQVSGAARYEFRVKLPDGTFVNVQPSAAGSNVSAAYTPTTAGGFSAQCRICLGAAANTCQDYNGL